MNVDYLIQLLTNKLTVLQNAKIQAYNAGDLPTINSIEEEILGTQNTLSQLRLLSTITATATATNTTPEQVITSGIDAVQNPVQGPSAGAVINGYDISAYATDPLYEDKIRSIIAGMPTFTTASDVDVYIQNLDPGSPVTGEMVFASTSQYGIDMPLLVAIMQNDSQFGMLGVGAVTFNPGNVGNTGSATQTYPSWAEGVGAVAEWLSRHKVSA